ncbi:unnamed protein product [Pedinophyceae sp. YPF-701]|nr:unnamed protein product [Pedinophyceae sp. YPF-701]
MGCGASVPAGRGTALLEPQPETRGRLMGKPIADWSTEEVRDFIQHVAGIPYDRFRDSFMALNGHALTQLTRESISAVPGLNPMWAIRLWAEVSDALEEQGYPVQGFALVQAMSAGPGELPRFSVAGVSVSGPKAARRTVAGACVDDDALTAARSMPAGTELRPRGVSFAAGEDPKKTHNITALTGQEEIVEKNAGMMKALGKLEGMDEGLAELAGNVAAKAAAVGGIAEKAMEFFDGEAGEAIKQIGAAAYKALDGLSEIASTVPFIAPLGIAVKMIFKVINGVMAQRRNCQKLQKMIEDMVVVVMEAKDSLHKFEKQIGELVDHIKKCHDHVAKFMRSGFLKKLTKSLADDKQFERLAKQLADKMDYFAKACVATTTKNVTAINEKMDQMMAELSSGSMFVSESKEIKELCDSMGGLDAVMGDPEKMKQLSAKMSISDQVLKGEMDEIKALMDEGPHRLIYHEDIRVFWRMNFRSTEVTWDIFFLGFTQRFYDIEGWLKANEQNIRRVLDVDGDGSVNALELNIAFPADKSLRESLEFMTSPGFVKNNLPDLPRNFFARERSQQRARKQLFEGHDSVRWLQIVGDVGLGKTTLAMGVGHEVVQQRQCGGVFFVDLTGKTTSEAAVYEIGAQLDIAVNDIDHLVQELPKKIEKLSPPKMMVILDNIENVLEEDEEDFVDAVSSLLNSEELKVGLRILSTSRVEVSEAIRDDYLAPGTGPPTAVMPVEEMTQTEITKWVMSFVRSEESQMKIRGELKKALKKSGSTLKPLQVQMIGSGLQRGKPPDVVVERVIAQSEDGSNWVLNSIADMSPVLQETCLRMLVFPSTFDEVAAEAVCGATVDMLDELMEFNIIKMCEAGRYKLQGEIRTWYNSTERGTVVRSSKRLGHFEHDEGPQFRKHYMSELRRSYKLFDSAKVEMGLQFFDRERANFHVLFSEGPSGMCGDDTLETAIDILRMDQMLDARLTIDDHNSLLKVAQTLVDFPPSPAPAPERTAELQAAKLEYEGMVHQKQARYSEALECYRQSRALLESDLLRDKTRLRQLCVAKIGAVLTIMGQYREALGELQGVFDAMQQARSAVQKEAPSDEAMLAARDAALSATLLANVHEKTGHFGEALKLYSDAVALEQEARGGEHPSVAKSLTAVGAVKASQGQYKEAVAKYNEALNICKAFFHEGHPLVASTQKRIADVKVLLGELSAAEEMYKEALTHLQEELGPNHPQCGEAVQGLGQAALGRADFDEALSCFQKAAKIFAKSLGKRHPQTAWVNLPMSEIYRRRAEYAQASEHAETALSTLVEVVGDQHPDVGDVLESKGEIAMALGRFGEAEQLYTQARAVFENTFGAEHPAVARTWRALGEVSAAQGFYARAIHELERARSIFEQSLGKEHWRVARVRVRAGDCRRELGQTDAARAEYDAAHSALTASLGERHPITAECIKGIGDLHLDKAEFGEASELYRFVISVFGEKRGRAHPSVNALRLELANVLIRRGLYAQAEETLEEASDSAGTILEKRHPFWASLAESRGNLAREQGQTGAAVDWYSQSLVLRKELLGDSHSSVGVSSRALGQAFMDDGKYEDALQCFKDAEEVFTNSLGESHWRVGRLQAYEALANDRLGRRQEAESKCVQGVRKLREALGATHPFLGEALAIEGEIFASGADFDKAVAAFGAAREIFAAVRGPQHPSVARMKRLTAEILCRKGEYAEATTLLNEAETSVRVMLGEAHPEMGELHEAFGNVCLATDDQTGARARFERALEVRQAAYGDTHESVGRALRGLGQAATEGGAYKEGLSFFARAKDTYAAALGAEHWRVGRATAMYADVCARLGKFDEAQACFDEGIKLLRAALGSEHPFVAEAMELEGDVKAAKGNFEGALTCYMEVIAVFRQVRGAWHPSCGRVLRKIGSVRCKNGDEDAASEALKQAREIVRAAFGDQHRELGDVAEGFGDLYMRQKRYDDALGAYEQARDAWVASLGKQHELVGRGMRAMAQAMLQLGRNDEARDLLREARDIYVNAYHGEGHWRVMRVDMLLGQAMAASGDVAGGKALAERAVAGIKATLESSDPVVAEADACMAAVSS